MSAVGILRDIPPLGVVQFDNSGITLYTSAQNGLWFNGSTYDIGLILPYDAVSSYSADALMLLESYWNQEFVNPVIGGGLYVPTVRTVSLNILGSTAFSQITTYVEEIPPMNQIALVSITNNTSATLTGPFQVVFTALTPGISLNNPDGMFGGSPYVIAGEGGFVFESIKPGGINAAAFFVQFVNPYEYDINCVPIVYSGNFSVCLTGASL